jgi:hypothetical protein
MLKHWFWYLLSAAVMLWYSTVTIYVAVNGLKDIKKMLATIGRTRDSEKP